jgi:spore coat polysaccharide biosynthesis protein SpsF (cytidylyltransferase family)
MFDTYVNRHTTEYVDRNITVNEHRAPTDKSVELLNEMTNKALKNITHNFSTTNNTLQVTGAIYHNQPMQERVFMCKFILNGKENKLQIDIPDWQYDTIESIVEALYKEVCNRLAAELMQPFLKEMSRNFY